MNYLLKSREEKRSVIRKNIFLAFVLVLLFLFLGNVFRSFSSNILLGIADPLWNGKNFVSNLFRSSLDGFFNNADLSNKVSEHELKEKEWQIKSVEFETLKNKIAELESFLDKKDDSKYILANILQKPPVTNFDIFLINSGKKDGIEKEQKVYANNYFPIGQISEVLESNSKVKAYSSNGEKINIRLASSTTEYEAQGRGNGEFSSIIPKDITVSIGNIVMNANDEIIGEVNYVEEDSAKVFQEILFKFPFNFSEINSVYVKIEK
ncbi:MAG: rod shape-determining protein MreC [bacterium]|nr:rod shape-determining protein MreC [bacterium]